ncbi:MULTISPECIES: hypothetical protein [Prauserella salsuginis group]|uniref:Uncharacterized protein n=1 Tax=Prauserella salsuginis TaxID=387889 RepID=A0ABW6G540_9PSEU|nr:MULTISPECIES: hypothetical protein [Prauserella salsuginis group]MCR3718873.1 hypothetical protein [Prauserella flava]MCR3733443.1 hypothetical protein [Prauserella salsuginis]
MAKTKNKLLRTVFRFWGYLVVAGVVYAWTARDVSLPIIIAGSCASLLYMLFAAPTWCLAPTRAHERCRNNAYGLLLGCWIRSHKWQNVTMLASSSRWAELMRRCWSGFGNAAASVSALAASLSAIVATVTLATG